MQGEFLPIANPINPLGAAALRGTGKTGTMCQCPPSTTSQIGIKGSGINSTKIRMFLHPLD
ncbi:MAG: hypothetical protein LBI05_02155 [Planctomycetaceae bacterium]|nr:hypothetical protein [Planctomycetaceae bacterium]